MIYRIPDEAYNRLANWARWATGYRWYMATTCCSAEGNYRAPAGEVMNEDRLSRPLPVDVRDAERVEKAWRDLPTHERELLRSHFIRGELPGRTCRRLRIHRHALEREVYAASMMLWRSLVETPHLVHCAA